MGVGGTVALMLPRCRFNAGGVGGGGERGKSMTLESWEYKLEDSS